jgi:outer membrane protein OmpA-like peptidoglycan-associated protein
MPKVSLIIFSFLFISSITRSQTETYIVNVAPFSSKQYDEYGPAYYKEGIVFCSNWNKNIILNYSNSENKAPFKILFADSSKNISWKDAHLFSTSLRTNLNDGPVSFSKDGTTIYYSRNQIIEGNAEALSSTRNKLGIFSSVMADGKWTKILEFRFNNEWYNITTPCLSPDGEKLYFASDKPGGYGGSDLYYCQLKNEYWDNPVNMGPVINSSGNESYPFISQSGDLYFASDGHKGLGGKDIFISKTKNDEWQVPVALDPPINSPSDDFALVTDNNSQEGYFSSKRNGTSDIFHYWKKLPQFTYCPIQIENQFCFSFKDDSLTDIGSSFLDYEWDFGDGKKNTGPRVEHCFPGIGKYMVTEKVINKKTNKIYFLKYKAEFEIKETEQAFIDCSPLGTKGETIKYNARKSILPGNEIVSYHWDFGDGSRATGEYVYHTYTSKGKYLVKLALTVKNNKTGAFSDVGSSKNIIITGTQSEAEAISLKSQINPIVIDSLFKYPHIQVKTFYLAKSDLAQESIYQLEILSSKSKIALNNSIFRNIPKNYELKEVYQPQDSTYSYVVDQGLSLLYLYPAYRDMIALGYSNSVVRIHIIKDAAEREINNLNKIYGIFADAFFEENEYKATPGAFPILDQIVEIMDKYPLIKLEIIAYSDDPGSTAYNLELSQMRAMTMANYLIKQGIRKERLITKGLGKSKPIAPSDKEEDRRINRRVEFIIINK